MRIGVVIPARNEAGRLAACLDSLAPFRDAGDPIVVVNADSEDGTAAVAARWGAEVLSISHQGRGRAVAAGYRRLSESVEAVLIAHADMRFPVEARDRIIDSLRNDAGAVGGALGHRIDDRRLRFRVIETGNRFRAALAQIPYGDQAMFVRVDSVRRAAGFPDQPALEDLELSLRLRRVGRWRYLNCPVSIDGRHWRRGVVRTTLRNWRIAVNYCLRRKEGALEHALEYR